MFPLKWIADVEVSDNFLTATNGKSNWQKATTIFVTDETTKNV